MELISNVILNMQSPAYATVYSPQGQTLARSIRATLMDGSTPWEIPAGALAVIRYAKPDGTVGFYDTLENGDLAYSFSGNIITFGLATQALTVPGTVYIQIDFYAEENVKLSTFTFRLEVQESVFPDEEIISDDYISVLTGKLSEAAEIFQQIKAAYGAPLTANTAAAMTDTTRVYVYTGTTGGGFTNGHWYYWNGSAWTDGGNYNSTGFQTDTTLSVSGAAADAQVTGIAVDTGLFPIEPNVNNWFRGYFTDSGVLVESTLNASPTNAPFRVAAGDVYSLVLNGLYAIVNTYSYSGGVYTKTSSTVYETDKTIVFPEATYISIQFQKFDGTTLPLSEITAKIYRQTNAKKQIDGMFKELSKYNSVDLLKDSADRNNAIVAGVSFVWSDDLSYVTVNGTATADAICSLYNLSNVLPKGIEAGKTYYIKVKTTASNLYLSIKQFDAVGALISSTNANGPTVLNVDSACDTMFIGFLAEQGGTYNDAIISDFAILNADSNLGLTERLNNLSIDVDETLSIPGEAADAQKTGALAAPVFSSANSYTAGQHVLHDGTLYVFNADHAAGAWTGTDATAVNLGGEISDLKNTAYQKPSGGIPASDMASAVQMSLEKADTALQSSDIDSTLTVPGKAADAKKTGDEISDVRNTLSHKADAIYDTSSGSIASFPDGADGLPVKELTVAIEPVQDTSGGDPSPTHICPISGWTGANVVVSPTTDAQDGTTYPISWQSSAETVYGGTLDVTTGVLTVDRAMVDLGTPTWERAASGTVYRTRLNGGKSGLPNSICSARKVVYPTRNDLTSDSDLAPYNVNDTYICGLAASYVDAAAFKAAMSGVQLVYELAQPTSVTLTATEIETLLGQNNIWADCGPVSVEYPADTKLYIQKINTPTDDDMIADANIASGKYFIINNNLYLSTAAILAGDPIKPGTNCTLTNLAAALNALNT